MLRPEIAETVWEELEAANVEIHQSAEVLVEANERYHAAIIGRLAVIAKIRNT